MPAAWWVAQQRKADVTHILITTCLFLWPLAANFIISLLRLTPTQSLDIFHNFATKNEPVHRKLQTVSEQTLDTIKYTELHASRRTEAVHNRFHLHQRLQRSGLSWLEGYKSKAQGKAHVLMCSVDNVMVERVFQRENHSAASFI